jgi:hypothetical protein
MRIAVMFSSMTMLTACSSENCSLTAKPRAVDLHRRLRLRVRLL